jgi:hypothetical protein
VFPALTPKKLEVQILLFKRIKRQIIIILFSFFLCLSLLLLPIAISANFGRHAYSFSLTHTLNPDCQKGTMNPAICITPK